MGAIGGGFFEAELEAHHEIDPRGRVLLERMENRRSAGAVDGVLFEDLVDLFFFVARAFDDLALFPDLFRRIVFGVALGGKIAAKAHRDRACSYLSEAGEDNDVGGGDGSGEAGGKSEGNGKSVGEADDDVPNGLGGLEVSFDVRVVGVRGAG